MSPEQFRSFEQELTRQLHHLVRTTIDQGQPVHREEVIAAAIHFCSEHLELILEDRSRSPRL